MQLYVAKIELREVEIKGIAHDLKLVGEPPPVVDAEVVVADTITDAALVEKTVVDGVVDLQVGIATESRGDVDHRVV